MIEFIIHLLGWSAVAINLLGCLSKDGAGFVRSQVPSSFLWSLHFLLLGAIGGALANIVAFLRTTIGIYLSQKLRVTLVTLCIPLMFILTYFFSESNFAYLTAIANTLMGFALIFEKNTAFVRVFNITARSLWVVYGAIVSSLPIIFIESICILFVIFSALGFTISISKPRPVRNTFKPLVALSQTLSRRPSPQPAE